MRPRTLYLAATAAWYLAFGLQSVVFTWLVTIVLREPAEFVGWAQTALLVPGMMLILVAGAFADRIGPDRQALWAHVFAAIIPWLLIGVLYLELLSFSVMVLYALLMGLALAFVTPARDGLLNHVAENKVQKTVMLASLCQFSFQIVGYQLASTADSVGPIPLLMLQSCVLLIGVCAYWLIRRSGAVQATNQVHVSIFQGIIEGAKTVNASPVMRMVVVQNVAMACFFMGTFIVSFPLLVREVYAGSSAEIATLNAWNSFGLVLTILIMLRVGYVQRPGRALLLFQGLGSAILMLSGFIEVFWVFVAVIFCWGLCGGITMPMSRTILQELAPAAQRGRVMSFYAFSFMGAGPLGTILCGYLSGLFGPQQAIIICGLMMLIVVVMVGLFSQLWHAKTATLGTPVSSS